QAARPRCQRLTKRRLVLARGGRTWWTHFAFTRINIEPIILRNKIEEQPHFGAFLPCDIVWSVSSSRRTTHETTGARMGAPQYGENAEVDPVFRGILEGTPSLPQVTTVQLVGQIGLKEDPAHTVLQGSIANCPG